jgi:hypothetical protein
MIFGAADIDRFTAVAPRPAIGRLRRHPAALAPHGIFPSGQCALAPIFVEISLRALREIFFPCFLEIGPCLFEGFGRALDLLAAVRPRIKAAVLSPLVDINRYAGADRDRSHMHVAIVDVPAIEALGISAAGERGHALLKRGRAATTIRYRLGIEGIRGVRGREDAEEAEGGLSGHVARREAVRPMKRWRRSAGG